MLMPMALTLDGVNGFDPATFAIVFGGVFEHSPWVAQRAYAQRPFEHVDQLHRAMVAAVDAATAAEQLALIRAHPQLAGKAAIRGELTDSSTREQKGAGLDQCSPEEFVRLTELNHAYEAKFGFPFIIAVRGHTRTSIIEAMVQRLSNGVQAEHAEALRQIARIARFRLEDLVGTR
jgi:2-oxo-4-hydroxy-4-carboxy-5-ureidoimidazoline decarboxylase